MADSDYESKMKYKIGVIERRAEKRVENITKTRTNEAEKGSERITEKVLDFYVNLDPMVSEAKEMMASTEKMDKALIPAHLDETMRKLNNIQKYTTDSTLFLPSYDVKNAQKMINDLNQEFQDLQSTVLPKKKFGFKGVKQKKGEENKQTESSLVEEKTSKLQLESGISVKDKINESIELEAAAVNSADVNLANLENCRIKVHGSPSTLHLANIKSCIVVTGPVSSSIFIEGCHQSKLVLSSQQLRIHNTVDTDFYIHVTAKAVIEDSHNLRFAPNPFLEETSPEVWALSRLDKLVNNWAQVGDFNWLAADKPSPHWSKLVSDQTWASSDQFFDQS